MAYIGNSPGVASQRVVTTFTATAGQTTFTPSSGYTLGYCDVFFNGVKLVNGDDYTASNGASVVLASAAAAGDSVEIVAHFPRGLSDGYLKAEADALLAQKQNSLGYTPVNQVNGQMTNPTLGGALRSANTDTQNQSQILLYEGTNGGLQLVSGYATSFLSYANSGTVGNVAYVAKGSGYFQVAYGIVAVVGTTFTVGASTYTVSYSSANGFVYVVENNSSAASTGTLTGLKYATERVRVDSVGRVTVPNQPYFYANNIDNTTKSSASGSTVVRYTNVRDSNGIGHGYNTSNGVFTAPVSGVYAFTWVYLMQGLTAGALIDDGYVWRDQFVFGGNRFKNNEPITNGDGYIAVKGSAVVKLPANDTFYVRCSLSGLTGNWNFYGDTNWGYLQGMLIG